MVMKKHLVRSRRVGVAEAKAELSRVLRDTASGPTVIHSRGRDVAVVLGIEEYERLVANDHAQSGTMAELLEDIAALKRRFGGGAALDVDRVDYEPPDPFSARRRR
jgi:prevent-host-death family protein